MLRLHGVSLTPQDAAHLADTLLNEGSTETAVATAELIRRAVRLEFDSVTLTPAQSDALLAVLNDPLGRTLTTLRDRLTRDQRDRDA